MQLRHCFQKTFRDAGFCLDAAKIEDHTPAPSRALTARENEKVEMKASLNFIAWSSCALELNAQVDGDARALSHGGEMG
jgi:hypothetical protein